MIRSLSRKTVAATAVAAALAAGGGAYAATSASKAPTPLTGNVTDEVAKAAAATFPGSTLVGLQSRPDGTYVARVRKSDGTIAVLTLDEKLAVTGTHEGGGGFGGPGGFGPRGHGGIGRGAASADLAKALGVSESKLRDALAKVRPQRGSLRDRADARVEEIAKALDATAADVREVLRDQRGRGFHGRRGGDPSELVSALAKKTGKSEDEVRKALDAARPDPGARLDELADELAAELGLDAAKVRTALRDARPGPGRRP